MNTVAYFRHFADAIGWDGVSARVGSGIEDGERQTRVGRGRWDRGQSDVERRKRTRELIVEAASTVVALRGVRGATAAEIIEVAGVGRNTFYEHFETSEAVVAEAVRRAADEMNAAVVAAVGAAPTPRERLRALCSVWLTELSRRATLLAAVCDGASEQRASIVRALEGELRGALDFARKSGAVGQTTTDGGRLSCVVGAFVGAAEHLVAHPLSDVRAMSEVLADVTLRAFR